MVDVVLYFLIALIATTVGSLAGLGGGVIIKPSLDAISSYDVATIGVLSSFTVFSMTIVSITKQVKSGVRFEGKRTSVLAIGAIVGGIFGKEIFSSVSNYYDGGLIKVIQASVLIILLLFVLLTVNNRDKLPQFNIKNFIGIIVIGTSLGFVAAFLGIGGGPINVAVLSLFFYMDSKKAAVHSVLIILFSQWAKLMMVFFTEGFADYNLKMLYAMVPAAIIGGFIGSIYNKKFTSEQITKVFNSMLIVMILVNVYNIVSNI